MTAWRPIRGTITRTDPDFTSEADIQKLFAGERILGRGATNPDNSAQFDFELAIAGRKRRVATLDENGELFKGRSLENLAAFLHEALSKVEVSLADSVLHSPMDIGAVDIDVDEADFSYERPASPPSLADQERAPLPASAVAKEYELRGPVFGLTDIATSELPVLAAAVGGHIGVRKLGELRLVVADKVIFPARYSLVAPDYALMCAFDAATGNPVLRVLRDGRETVWDWGGELAPFTWIYQVAVPEIAADFVREELGAGGFARLAVADLVDATFADVRGALLAHPAVAVRELVTALGLPTEVLEVVSGDAPIESIPEIRVFEPRSAAGTFTEALAWEVAGEGHVSSGLAGAFRSVYLKRPWLTSMVAAAQAGIGGVVLMNGIQKSTRDSRSVWKIVAGALLITNALSRIATIQYMNDAVERFVGDAGSAGFAASAGSASEAERRAEDE